jgi:biopolymer transport protein ExbD
VAISTNGGGFGGGSGFGSRRRGGGGSLAEINVTPFVDVVLVLLIIFMLTAHVMEFGIQIDVPKIKETPRETAEELPVVNLNRQAQLFLNEKPITLVGLTDAIHQRFGQQKAVYLRADAQCPWEQVAQVMAVLGDSKFQINTVTQPDDSLNKGKQ